MGTTIDTHEGNIVFGTFGDGDVTLAEVGVRLPWATFTAVAHSKRMPGDDAENSIGSTIALGRALKKLGKELEQAGHAISDESCRIKVEVKAQRKREHAARVAAERGVSNRPLNGDGVADPERVTNSSNEETTPAMPPMLIELLDNLRAAGAHVEIVHLSS